MSLTDASGCSQRKIFLDFPPFWRFSALYGSWAAQAPGSVKKIEINTCFDKLVPWVNIKRGSIGMKKDLLFEIGTEEIPAGFVPRALASLKAALEGRLSSGRLEFDSIMTMGTPRRLALMVKGLTDSQPDARVEVRGPNTKAAFDEGGKPTRALEGFARAQGVKLKDIKVVKTDKGEHVLAVKEVKGEKTLRILPGILKEVLSIEMFAKSMRWGAYDVSFARPVHWILALYGGRKVGFEFGHLKSSDKTFGHRFLSPDGKRGKK